MSLKVVAFDDNSVAMRGAAEVLRAHRIFTFGGMVQNMQDLRDEDSGQRTVLLMDPFSQADVGLDDVPNVPKQYSVLVMSACTHPGTVRQALQLGVSGYISKAVDTATLLDAISAVGVGGIYLGQPVNDLFGEDAAAPSPPRAALEKLTPRERDVLVMVAQGFTHRQIGSRLQLSKATVDTYVHRVRQKVGPVNKAGLTRLAMELGLLQRDAPQTSPDDA